MSHTKPLPILFANFPALTSVPDIEITGIAVDSRLVQPGQLFVATSDTHDGHVYIPQAVENGAVAALGTKPIPDAGVPYIQVEDSRGALAALSAAFFDFPSKQMTLIGVTGTDGKTTTANLIYQILLAAGLKAGMVTTVNAIIGDVELDTGFHVTTPEAFDVQRYLAQMGDAGITHVVLEATSHGLAARRLIPEQFDIAVVTNITHEHLDFHGSYEAYRAAKGLLFAGLSRAEDKSLQPPRAGILNMDDISYDYLAEITGVDQISYGLQPDALIRAENIHTTPSGLQFTAIHADQHYPISSSLVGDYNVSNILAALAVAVPVLGIDPITAAQGVAAMRAVPGRMEVIDMGQSFTAIVDFAHTPNALLSVLKAARNMTDGRIIAVFGSAGLRDRAKRRMMAEASAELADISVLTAEDPRTESLDDILAEMAAGAVSKGAVEGETFFRIPDRGTAIRSALDLAQPGDLVLALGKGHEQSMCFIETEYPWDDRTAMRAALADFLTITGPEMPYLPTQEEEMPPSVD
ncbi:MAG: UDP-N-acetylmuramoyl-L-alanyl-D-glutamate--2,6-diaminopimelate ligase [Anaerolineae bacterium]|nr:UDP-N-acetylmuramoyl-L-alanyl-D-glutamate--2,6-diaminopimelate ligase [Anaerolineae bacterium]